MTAHAPLPLRRALLLGCAIGGLVLASRIDRADAQAFNALPKTVAGTVTYDRATPGVETVMVGSPTAIINWVPGVGVFLPAGNTATFTNAVGTLDYVVLNRIQSSTPIRFDGHVISLIQDFAVGTSNIGGTVLFSSPGGIIVGPSAVFDVGSLVLTSLNVLDDGTGNFYDPATQGYQFAPGGLPDAAVITLPGAQINAPNEGSYVALVGPQVMHGGAIRVNGSAAFIAGQQVQMRVNQGLFDIIIEAGTPVPVPLVHTGSTGGPASTGAGDVHRIYMVARPVNQAITGILQGSAGFDPAMNAAIENGAIILSAGFNIAGGEVDRFGDFSPGPVPGIGASFEIRGGNYTSDLFGYAVTDMLAGTAVGANLNFSQDVSLFAGSRAHLFSGNANQSVFVGGNALVSAASNNSADPAVIDHKGGEALIFANKGGSMVILGNATVDASGQGELSVVLSRGGNGSGGTAGIFADAGTVQIGGNVNVRATGAGGVTASSVDTGGTGTGGTAFVDGRTGGAVQIGGALAMDASGTGSDQSGFILGPGAPGTGGAVRVAADGGGAVVVNGAVTLVSNGTGGNVPGNNNVGGAGQGGTVSILSGGNIQFRGDTVIAANAFGGIGAIGGNATGGTVIVESNQGKITLAANTDIDAEATGGDALFGAGGRAGDGTGGTVTVRARSGVNPSSIGGGAIDISARGTGGHGAQGLPGNPGSRGGDGRGGTIALTAESANGTLQLGAVIAFANGIGGAGGNFDSANGGGRGGDGFGGSVQLGTVAGPAAPTLTGGATFALVNAGASGTGGAGGSGAGAGGNATGGTATLTATGVTTRINGDTILAANATGGAGGAPGVGGGPTGTQGLADGGNILLTGTQGGTLTAGDVTGTATATGAPGTGNSPGEWHVSAANGATITLANLTLSATATGTPAVRPFSSLEPLAGTITVTQVANLSTQGEIRVIADAGGRITGGRLNLAAGDDITLSHSNVQPTSVTIDVTDFFALAGDDFTAGAGVLTRSANQTDIRALDLATIAGRVVGRDIVIGSADIDVQATGAIGDAGTLTATLLVSPLATVPAGRFTVLGGTTQGPGYTLTNAEAGRIRAGTLTIQSPLIGGAIQDLLVRDLTFTGGGAGAGIGNLVIVTPGIARVEGALAMTNAGASGGISFTATRRLEIATPTGSIRVRDGAGGPGGSLSLASDNIWVASQAIIDQLRLDPNYANRDADLLFNLGAVEPRGYVEGGAVVLRTGGTLFVQNSGLSFSPAFGGITVGAGGLIVRGPDTAALGNVTAFGRQLNADGSFVIGPPFFFLVGFQTPGVPLATDYTAGSTFNTCFIVTGQCGGPPSLQPAGPDPITGPVGGSAAILLPLAGEEDELVDTSFSADPLIEEPVTSGGESSLWGCDDDDDQDDDCHVPNR